MLPIDPDIPATAVVACLHPASRSLTWIRSASLPICLYFAHSFRAGANEDCALYKRVMKLGDLLTSSGLVAQRYLTPQWEHLHGSITRSFGCADARFGSETKLWKEAVNWMQLSSIL